MPIETIKDTLPKDDNIKVTKHNAIGLVKIGSLMKK